MSGLLPENQARQDVGVADQRPIGGEDHVAIQSDGCSEPGRRAVYLGDDGFFQVQQAEHDFLRLPRNLAPHIRRVDHGLLPFHVALRRKTPAGPGENHHVRLSVEVDVGEHPRQLLMHDRIHGIELVRPVHGYGQQPPLPFNLQRLIAIYHCVSPIYAEHFALPPPQLGDALLCPQIYQHIPNLLFGSF